MLAIGFCALTRCLGRGICWLRAGRRSTGSEERIRDAGGQLLKIVQCEVGHIVLSCSASVKALLIGALPAMKVTAVAVFLNIGVYLGCEGLLGVGPPTFRFLHSAGCCVAVLGIMVT